MRNRTTFFAAAVLIAAAAAIALGLRTVGGPVEARQEKLDAGRLMDLAEIADALRCKDRQGARRVLPQVLTAGSLRDHCVEAGVDEKRLFDRETGKRYRYIRKDGLEFSICARFYDAQKLNRLADPYTRKRTAFNPETGCIVGRVD